MGRPQTVLEKRWDLRELQKKLKKLGVVPPAPGGQAVKADIMKPGCFYVVPEEALDAYLADLKAALEAHAHTWTAQAFMHTVLAAAQDAAPESERLVRPHGHVPARPVIDNHGYLALALLAVEHVASLVPEGDRERFERWRELGQRVASGSPLTASDHALLDREVPNVVQPTRAYSRNVTATSPALVVAQAMGLEAEQAALNNVAGKGARLACSACVRMLAAPRGFLEQLDRLIQLEDARLQFRKVSVRPSAPVVAARWRGAERGKSSHWVTELDNGTWALLFKAKGQWRLVEGPRDEVLASVPDLHLALALKAVLGPTH